MSEVSDGGSHVEVFLSYSSRDQDYVHPLGRLLKASGSRPFVDVFDLEFEQDWAQQIDRAIHSCKRVLVFLTRHAAESQQVEREWRLALSIGKPVVPVLMAREPQLPSELGRFHGVRLFQIFDQVFSGGGSFGVIPSARTMREFGRLASQEFACAAPGLIPTSKADSWDENLWRAMVAVRSLGG